MTIGATDEVARAWVDALAEFADESGDDIASAARPHVFDEARYYLAGLCTGLGVELPEATTSAWLAGEGLADVLRQECTR